MDLTPEPMQRFAELHARAKQSCPRDADNMVVATVGADGRPSCRTVLLKAADPRGFVFYTNTRGRKGRELGLHPHAALLFYYPDLGEQVSVEGPVEPVTAAEADAYFATRPRLSQLGAWASHQSEPLAAREDLEARVRDADALYAGKEVPRPQHWSGFRVLPARIEFWRAHPNRLHDRCEYLREGAGWKTRLLNP
jgi:pyridoxamine 5'-phosphate oxidase